MLLLLFYFGLTMTFLGGESTEEKIAPGGRIMIVSPLEVPLGNIIISFNKHKQTCKSGGMIEDV